MLFQTNLYRSERDDLLYVDILVARTSCHDLSQVISKANVPFRLVREEHMLSTSTRLAYSSLKRLLEKIIAVDAVNWRSIERSVSSILYIFLVRATCSSHPMFTVPFLLLDLSLLFISFTDLEGTSQRSLPCSLPDSAMVRQQGVALQSK